MNLNFKKGQLFWINKPQKYYIDTKKVEITTEPRTDFWQNTYYNFQHDNAPALLTKISDMNFSFLVKTEFNSKKQFDQCGVIIYQNSENWLKASIEYENEEFQRLGSVVTNQGFSDWATTDIPMKQRFMYYRLSRHNNDFCIENSYDGIHYKQMRITHLFDGNKEIQIGIYACSPSESSFTAIFSKIAFTECQWK